MKRVVISGATSMVGIALIEECIKHKVEILALVRRNSKNINRIPDCENIKVIECDLEEIKNFSINENNFDVFYHLGWSNTSKAARNDISEQVRNIDYSLDAVELAMRLRCKKFIGAGSQAEYGIHLEDKTKPDSCLNPQNAYGICKMAAGKLCSVAAAKKGMDFAWVRIFSLYGKYESSETLIQSILPQLIRNESCSLTEGIQKWDYLYSSDAGEAFYKIGEKTIGSNFYCLGSGQACSLQQYVQMMKAATKSKSELKFGDIPYKNTESRGMCADITALENDIEWRPRTSFPEGILNEIQRIKEYENDDI